MTVKTEHLIMICATAILCSVAIGNGLSESGQDCDCHSSIERVEAHEPR